MPNSRQVAVHPDLPQEDRKFVDRWLLWPQRVAVITCSCLIVTVMVVTGIVLLPDSSFPFWIVLAVVWAMWLLFMDYHVFEPVNLVTRFKTQQQVVQLPGDLWDFYQDQYERIQANVPEDKREELRRTLYLSVLEASQAQAIMEQNSSTGDTPSNAAYADAKAKYDAACLKAIEHINMWDDAEQD